jgi:diaminohydroxyphosphoribosylaminopyrimidine deaminase/5-amino-6-(5-phosphoribosylamino)uracil reductase
LRNQGRTWPNPAVGCVLVQDGRVVGRGWTQAGGRPHGEVVALARAGAAARGATAYVSLEPCAHHGLTPPCAAALVNAGIARVVTALTDPDPRVSGRGHDLLRRSGIALTEGVGAAEAAEANAGFLMRLRARRPRVTLKLALTLDGRIATSAGTSRWITGPEARRRVHLMRSSHDAVLIGAGTARADDPDLRVRELGTDWQPVRIVADSRLGLTVSSRLGHTVGQAPVWLLHGARAVPATRNDWARMGAETICCETDPLGRLDMVDALTRLADRGLTRVFCEGGGGLGASLLQAGLVDELVVFTAGHAFGADGTAGLAAMGVTSIGPRPFDLVETARCGADLMHRWRRAPGPA